MRGSVVGRAKTMRTNSEVHHLVLTPEGGLREFPPELAAKVAAGAGKLPELANRRVRYVQVTVSDESEGELKVVTAGASIRFDRDGRLTEAGPIGTDDPRISPFEHDACVQWALRNWPAPPIVFH
jgi:hypothetical protein